MRVSFETVEKTHTSLRIPRSTVVLLVLCNCAANYCLQDLSNRARGKILALSIELWTQTFRRRSDYLRLHEAKNIAFGLSCDVNVLYATHRCDTRPRSERVRPAGR